MVNRDEFNNYVVKQTNKYQKNMVLKLEQGSVGWAYLPNAIDIYLVIGAKNYSPTI